ncbi:MAG: hypothetical protein BAJATHORv1_20012 [Candidatus Thorarchaeota archaeon]|nr:MAG: hypothetical protein BAJATHORv1_20012 [Candidatus Thorarchaeota archaeon]
MSQFTGGILSQKELQELRRLRAVREALDRLKRRGISADFPICPNCKSARIIDLTSYHDLGYIGSFQPAYYCLDCGWYGRSLAVMSNRDLSDKVLRDLEATYPELMERETKQDIRDESF